MGAREPIAWLLNLDAEHELEASGRYAPTRRLRGIVARQARRLVGPLVRPGDVVVDPDADGGDERARGLRGVAWSPTPRALARLDAVGARSDPAPALDVLRAVNARPLAAEVRAPLARDSFAKHVVATLDEALARLARPAPLGWLVRRSFGAAGRGRRRLRAGRPDASERAWLAASLRLGPLVIEPWVEVTVEATRSGWVRPSGEVVVAAPCWQETTSSGAWVRSEATTRAEAGAEDDARLEEAAHRAGEALAAHGYFGPFGIDAYRHRRLDGPGEVLNPLSEINARLTMDWWIGMGGMRGVSGMADRARELPTPPAPERASFGRP